MEVGPDAAHPLLELLELLSIDNTEIVDLVNAGADCPGDSESEMDEDPSDVIAAPGAEAGAIAPDAVCASAPPDPAPADPCGPAGLPQLLSELGLRSSTWDECELVSTNGRPICCVRYVGECSIKFTCKQHRRRCGLFLTYSATRPVHTVLAAGYRWAAAALDSGCTFAAHEDLARDTKVGLGMRVRG